MLVALLAKVVSGQTCKQSLPLRKTEGLRVVRQDKHVFAVDWQVAQGELQAMHCLLIGT